MITGGIGFISWPSSWCRWAPELTLADSLIAGAGGNLRDVCSIRERVNVNVCDVRDRFAMEYLVQTRYL